MISKLSLSLHLYLLIRMSLSEIAQNMNVQKKFNFKENWITTEEFSSEFIIIWVFEKLQFRYWYWNFSRWKDLMMS